MPLYTIQDNVDSQYASDVNQLVEGLTGNADIGQLKLLSPLSPPAAPTAAINTNLGNLTGAYKYVVAFVTGYWHGEPVTGTLLVQGNTGYGTASGTINPNGQQGALSAIPTGPAGTVARILGRTKAEGSTFYQLAQINDNTTTSWTDNTPDAGLTVALTQTNTTGSKFVGDGSGLTNLPASTELAIHLADYVYQTPTIVGTQIQITQQSTTKRINLKLGADVTGGAITISTDSGVTSKPLVDINGVAITQLEKGFVEVVADATFFTLRNRGISGTEKQALIDIVNEAEANDSALKTQYITAVNAVDTDGGINLPADATWADILAVLPFIKTGPKVASGTALADSVGRITVNALTFRPSYVFLGLNTPDNVERALVGVLQDVPDSFLKRYALTSLYGHVPHMPSGWAMAKGQYNSTPMLNNGFSIEQDVVSREINWYAIG